MQTNDGPHDAPRSSLSRPSPSDIFEHLLDPELRNALASSGCPKRHVMHSMDVEADGRWGEALDRMIPNLGEGATWLLAGPRGTGKTQIGTLLCAAVILLHGRARYTIAQEMFIALRAAFDGPTTLDASLRSYHRPHLLVIDDLQCRQDTDWEDETLGYIIDKRYGAMRDTLLITNETEEVALERLGPSIADRMRESGAVILCDWESYRGREVSP